MKSIGIFGQGFVGNAIYQGFKKHANVLTYDKIEEKSNSNPEEIVNECQVIFICVPTPMHAETGEASIHYVEDVILQIDDIAEEFGTNPTLIIKSTIPVGSSSRLNSISRYCDVIFSPEFLTEANAVKDFKNQKRIVLGHEEDFNPEIVIETFRLAFPKAKIVSLEPAEAEMVKYVTNTFLATKVSYANEIYNICSNAHIDYDKVIEAASLDKRLGDSHWMVPGPDGDRGFGGHCFPKDLNGLRYIANQDGIEVDVLTAALKTNDRVRENRDWESQEGRAIINSESIKSNKVKSFLSSLFA
jgi:UDPglucose 6-dehydrogenase